MTSKYFAKAPVPLYQRPRELPKHIWRMAKGLWRTLVQSVVPFEPYPKLPRPLPTGSSKAADAIDEEQLEQAKWMFDQADGRRDQLERKALATFAIVSFLSPLVASILVLLLRQDSEVQRGLTTTPLLVACVVFIALAFLSAVRALAVQGREALYLGALVDLDHGDFRKFSRAFYARGLLYCVAVNTAMNDHIAQLVKGAQVLVALAVFTMLTAAIPVATAISSGRGAAPTKVELSQPLHISTESLLMLRDALTHSIGSPRIDELTNLRASLTAAQTRVEEQSARLAILEQQFMHQGERMIQQLIHVQSAVLDALKNTAFSTAKATMIGDRIVLPAEILFSSGSAALLPRSWAQLNLVGQRVDELVSRLPRGAKWVLEIAGYSDDLPVVSGPFQSNRDLSYARAMTVVNYFLDRGISGVHLFGVGYGDQYPIASNDNETGRSQNRRVELRLVTTF